MALRSSRRNLRSHRLSSEDQDQSPMGSASAGLLSSWNQSASLSEHGQFLAHNSPQVPASSQPLYCQSWPEVRPAINVGYGHGIDPAHQLRYAFYFSNGLPLPTPPSSPRDNQQSIPHAPKLFYQQSPSSSMVPTFSACDHSYEDLPVPDPITLKLQGMHISCAHASVSADEIYNTNKTLLSPPRNKHIAMHQLEDAKDDHGTEDLEVFENSHVSNTCQPIKTLRNKHTDITQAEIVDTKMEQLQQKLSTLKGFMEERKLGLEWEKEQHLENIVARVAPGESDPGYKAPCFDHASSGREYSLQADSHLANFVKRAMAGAEKPLEVRHLSNPHLKRKYEPDESEEADSGQNDGKYELAASISHPFDFSIDLKFV